MPELIEIFTLDSSIGTLRGAVSQRGLMVLCFANRDEAYFQNLVKKRAPKAELKEVPPEETLAGREIAAYLNGGLTKFSCPVDLEGLSGFSRAVYEVMLQIPFGRTMSYGDIAKKIGRPKASQAVGQASGANPMPIVVPCHRVVGSKGSLTGFGGGLETKQALLALENMGLPFA